MEPPKKDYPVTAPTPRLAILAGSADEFRDCVFARNLFSEAPLWIVSANDCMKLWRMGEGYKLWLIGSYKEHPLWRSLGFKETIKKATKVEEFGFFPSSSKKKEKPIIIDLLAALEMA